MKKLLPFTLLFGFGAWSAPVIGDQARYVVSEIQAQETSKVNMSMTITGINEPAKSLSVRQILWTGNQTLMDQTLDEPADTVLFPTEEEIANCTQHANGTTTAALETIKVTAGLFTACHLHSEDPSTGEITDVFQGSVPFGYLKSVVQNRSAGTTQTMELISYIKF